MIWGISGYAQKNNFYAYKTWKNSVKKKYNFSFIEKKRYEKMKNKKNVKSLKYH